MSHRSVKVSLLPTLWKMFFAVTVTGAVFCGIFSIFAQFNAGSVPSVFITHTADSNITYYEWDSDGVRYERAAVYDEFGFFAGLSGSEIMDAAKASSGQFPAGGSAAAFGYSFVLNGPYEDIYDPRLTLRNTGDIPYVIFLDEKVIYSDYPVQSGSITALYSRDAPREITVSLPPDYTGKTLAITEHLTSAQMSSWYPAAVEIASSESAGLYAVMNYGPSGLMGGMAAMVLVIFTMLFLRRLSEGRHPYLLLLPVFYTLICMVSTALYINFGTESALYRFHSLVYAFSVYCAGDLLLIFLAFKMKIIPRIVLAAVSSVHFLITAGLLLRQYISGEELMLFTPWSGLMGFAVLLLAVALILYESRDSRYFKYGGWLILFLTAFYAFITVVFRFINPSIFFELINPVLTVVSLNFYPLNRLLSVRTVIVIAFLSVMEYISETTERRARLAALEQINRLKTEFLGNVSHELKTPLTVISSYAQITEKGVKQCPDYESVRHNMQLIGSEAERLSLMVSQILDVTRIEEGRLNIYVQLCDLTEIVQNTLNTYYPVFQKNRNKLLFEPSDGRIDVLCDPDRIIQVLVNLVGNASRHTQNGVISVLISAGEAFAAVEVTDNGKGIDAERLVHVFDRYYTSQTGKKAGDIGNTGTGLGLYICKHIINEHGGDITIESEVGKGTVVRFTLPLSA